MALRGGLVLLAVCATLFAAPARADILYSESPRTGALRLKLGSFNPRQSFDAGLSQPVYAQTFGDRGLLLFELGYERYLWKKVGALGVGFSAGYGERYGNAFVLNDPAASSGVKTALHLMPLTLYALYNFDYAALKWGVPLTPYARLGLAYTGWWITKGGGVEYAGGRRGAGGKWGWTAAGGLAFLLDVLEPRLARDFDTDIGVNHTYVFAEYVMLQADGFGGTGFDFSDDYLTFGFNFEF